MNWLSAVWLSSPQQEWTEPPKLSLGLDQCNGVKQTPVSKSPYGAVFVCLFVWLYAPMGLWFLTYMTDLRKSVWCFYVFQRGVWSHAEQQHWWINQPPPVCYMLCHLLLMRVRKKAIVLMSQIFWTTSLPMVDNNKGAKKGSFGSLKSQSISLKNQSMIL